MRHTRKHMLTVCLSLLLVVSMVLGLPMSAMAAASTPAPGTAAVKDINGDGKITYVSFGDSVTNGYGMEGYRYADGTNARGYTREVAGSYPALTAAYLESLGYRVDWQQLAIGGYRMDELNWMLNPSQYQADAYHKAVFAGWNKSAAANLLSASTGEDGTAFRNQAKALGFATDADILANADTVISAGYVNAVKDADLITIDLGTNNFGGALMAAVEQTLGLSAAEVQPAFTQYLDANSAAALDAVAGNIAAQLAGTDAAALKLYSTVTRSLIYGYLGFVNHYDAAIQQIYALNPAAQVVVLDIYSMLSGVELGTNADLGALYNLFVGLANTYARELSPWASKVTHASLDGAPELMADAVKAYEENKKAGTYADTQYMQPAAEALLNDLVMELMGMDPNVPAQRDEYQKDVPAASELVNGFVSDLKNKVKELAYKPVLDAVATAEANVVDSVEGVANAKMVVQIVVELAIDGEYKDQFKGSATPGLFKTVAINTIKKNLDENEDLMIKIGIEPTDANKDRVADEIYKVACVYYDEMHRDGGSRESAEKLAVLEIMRFVLVETRGMSDADATANAALAWELDQIYQTQKAATGSDEKAKTATTLAALKTQSAYAGEGVAESMYNVYTGNFTEADSLKVLALQGISAEKAKSIHICYTTDLNGQFENDDVKTAAIYAMEKSLGILNAEFKYDQALQYRNIAATVAKIASSKTINVNALAAAKPDMKAFADKLLKGTLTLEGTDASLALLYFRYLAVDGAFSMPTAAGHQKLAAAVKAALEKLTVAEADSDIVLTKDSKLLILGDFIAAAENGYVEKVIQSSSVDYTTNNLSRKGFRINEVRALLDGNYAGDAYTAAVLGQDKAALSKQYTDAVKASNVILFHLGAENLAFLAQQMDLYTGSEGKNSYAMSFAGISGMGGQMDALLGKFFQSMTSDMKTAGQMLAFETQHYGYATFADCLDKTVETIQKLNPNAHIILVGQYELAEGSYYDAADIRVEMGQLVGKNAERMNTCLQNYADMTDNATYIDVTGAETVLSQSAEKNMAGKDVFAAKALPTAKGADYIAKRMGCALGGHTLADKTKITWSWSGNYSTATASYICAKCEFPVQLNAAVTKTEKRHCVETGIATYTATIHLDEDITDVKTVELAPTGHTYGDAVWTWEQDLTMASAKFTCTNGCGHEETAMAIIRTQTTEPTCGAEGKLTMTATVTMGGKEHTDVKETVIPAATHNLTNPVWTWAEDCSTATVSLTCSVCNHTATGEGVITEESSKVPNCFVDGEVKYLARATVAGQEYTERKTRILPASHNYVNGVCTICKDDINDYNLYRLYGKNRYQTSIAVADALKKELGVSQFDNIIVASGNSFADALAGSYLAAKLKAPILITSANNQEIIQMYVFKSLKSGGTLYILGGEKAVQPSFVAGLESFLNIKRLEGSNRYETNLAILKEEKAAVAPGSEILVCTGTDFADSLSASATGKPILLVRNTLTDSQKEYLHSLGTNSKFTIIGGVNAVSEGIAEELKAYGTVSRLEGNNRYETATWVANAYFNKPKTAVLAYGHNFPDGLCGGPLAYFTGAPLLLAHDSRVHPADAFTDAFGITQGYVLGGEAVLSDESVLNIFDTKAELFVENETVVSEDSLTGDLGGSLGDSLGDIDPDQLEGILGDLLGGLLGGGSEGTEPAPEATPAQ